MTPLIFGITEAMVAYSMAAVSITWLVIGGIVAVRERR